MAELFWFAFFAADWLSSPTIAAMEPAQEGAYIRLLATAWGNGKVEPSLPANDKALASMSRLGAKWKRLGPAIRAQFVERGGKLYNAKLSEAWRDGQQRHIDAVTRGKIGADKRWKKRGQSIDALIEEPIEQPRTDQWLEDRPRYAESESEEQLVAPTEPTSMFPPEALGVETPRPAEGWEKWLADHPGERIPARFS